MESSRPNLLRRLRAAYDRRASLRWAVDLGLLVLLISGVGLWQTRAHVRGGPVPPFSLSTLDGSATISAKSLEGKPTLLAFWAPWCDVCAVESKNLGWVQRLAGARANVISVATSFESPQQVSAYTQRNGVDYPVLLDDGTLATTLKVSSFPTVYFLDEAGQVKGSVVGYTTTGGLLLRTLW